MSTDKDDLIKRAEQVRDEYREGGNTATRIGQLFLDIINFASSLDVNKLRNYFLRKDQDDRTEHSLGVGGSLDVDGEAHVGTNATVGGTATVEGDSNVMGNASVGGSQTVVGDSSVGGDQTVKGNQAVEGASLIKGLLSLLTGAASPDFLSGFLGHGFELRFNQETGRWRLEVDELMARVVATFFELVISKLRHVGGSIVLSPGSMQCIRVEETADAYRCYFKASEGDKTVANEFVVGDQARSQEFNLKRLDGGGVRTAFYWRLVTAVGDDWIDLSKTDCADLSGVPAPGDDIVQLGNRDDVTRQNAIILDTTGSDAPSIKQYHGINSYVLDDDMAITVFSSRGNRIRGQFISEATGKDYDETMATLGDSLIAIGEQMKGIKVDVDAIKAQSDREYTLWFGEVDPTAGNAPASEWQTEEEKAVHVEDIYYNRVGGHAWRWMAIGDGSYGWQDITDQETLRALEKASKAQDTADGKRRNFVVQPAYADAYDVGDTWSNATFGELYDNDTLVCITAKVAGAPFSISHWRPASNVTTAYIMNLGNEIRQVVADNKAAGDQATAAAKAAADAAQKAADNAATAASKAQSTADGAVTAASNAATAASNAQSTAGEAKSAATANATAIVQTNDSISALSGKFTFDADGNVKNIDKSGLLLTSEAAKLYTAVETTNALGQRMATAESNITTNANNVSALSKKFTFDSNGNVTNVNQSGVVLTSQFASLYSEAVNKDTNVVKKAEISTMVTKDANGYLQSGVKVKGDNIKLEGYTTVNGGFKVKENGDVELNNAVVSGYLMEKPHRFANRIGKFNLNPDKGSVFIAKTQFGTSSDYAYYKLPSAKKYAGRSITVIALATEWITNGSSATWYLEMEHANRYVITSDGFGTLYNMSTNSQTTAYAGGNFCSKMKLDPRRGVYRFISDGEQWYEFGGNYDNLQATSDELSGTFEDPID